MQLELLLLMRSNPCIQYIGVGSDCGLFLYPTAGAARRKGVLYLNDYTAVTYSYLVGRRNGGTKL